MIWREEEHPRVAGRFVKKTQDVPGQGVVMTENRLPGLGYQPYDAAINAANAVATGDSEGVLAKIRHARSVTGREKNADTMLAGAETAIGNGDWEGTVRHLCGAFGCYAFGSMPDISQMPLPPGQPCSGCGAPSTPNARFCTECGQRLVPA